MERSSILITIIGEDAKLAEEIIMSYLSKSAVWPGIDITTCEECYLLRATYRDGTISDYYTFYMKVKLLCREVMKEFITV